MKKLSQSNIREELSSATVILYGAGITGKRIIELIRPFQISVKYIVDDDENKHGLKIGGGGEIISYAELLNLSQQFNRISVIVTSIYGKTILKNLDAIENIQIYEMYDWVENMYGSNRWSNCMNEDDLALFKKETDSLKYSLADDESIQVLDGVYHYLRSKDLKCIYDICSEYDQYFIPEIIDAIDKSLTIVDAGAYEGELYQTIKKHNIDLEKWYCFEADCENYARLLQRSQKSDLQDVAVCIGAGVWSHDGTLYFEEGKGTESKIVDYKTDNKIKVISLDSYFENKKCNFIKMDVEGAEYPALCGGIHIIRRDRPILTISIYHSMEDYYRIPKYLKNELQDYKFYIRHHSLVLSETVLYAIPDELIKK